MEKCNQLVCATTLMLGLVSGAYANQHASINQALQDDVMAELNVVVTQISQPNVKDMVEAQIASTYNSLKQTTLLAAIKAKQDAKINQGELLIENKQIAD